MNVAEFEDLVDRLGEDLSRWPDAQRLAATDLLTASAEARALHAEAEALRRALAPTPVRAPAGLADRIVAAARHAEQAPAQTDEAASETAVSADRR